MLHKHLDYIFLCYMSNPKIKVGDAKFQNMQAKTLNLAVVLTLAKSLNRRLCVRMQHLRVINTKTFMFGVLNKHSLSYKRM